MSDTASPERITVAAPAATVSISDEEFHRLQKMILDHAGIALAESKRQLVMSRLARRLRHHGYSSFGQYIAHLERQDLEGSERRELLNAITTNKTDFFRESHHFDFLRDELTRLIEGRIRRGEARRIRIWSAACSSGEEPYSIAITLRETFGEMRGWDVRILASDLDTNVLAHAAAGVYEPARLAGIPGAVRARYFTDTDEGIRVAPCVQELITFRQINLNGKWAFRAPFDAIFCRNVVIYFNRQSQDVLFRRMARALQAEGHLFLGHSESLHWMSDVYRPVGRTIYRLGGDGAARATPPAPSPGAKASPEPRSHRSEGDHRPSDVRERPPRRGRPDGVLRRATPHPDEASLRHETIHIGGVFASREPAVIRTVLGSCVSVCLFDADRGIGGMNHFMLPESQNDRNLPSRYGVHAMELLINRIMNLGGERRALRAKVMGGAYVLRMETTPFGIGERNIEFARQFLARENIPIVAERLGGTQPLQVLCHTHSGRVRVRALGRDRIGELVHEELRYRITVTRESEAPVAAGDVTLF